MKIFKSALVSLFGFLVATPVLATRIDNPGGGGDTSDTPATIGALGDVLTRVMDYIFPIAGILCVVFIIIGGYMWIISAGDPSKVKQAQGTLTWAIIGLVFVLIAVAVVKIIEGAL